MAFEIGWRSGFDSGLSLDYVYKNKPHGSSPLGRLIDKSYLNSIGWRGIRQRKENLNKTLRDLILKVHREKEPVRILDIAAGAGRYVIETIRDMPKIPIGAMLCDYREENVDAMRALADELNVDGAVSRAEAMRSIAKLSPEFSRANDRNRLRPLRIVSLKRIGPEFVTRAGGCDRAWRLPHLHESALASAARIHRPCFGNREGERVDHAPPDDGRNG